MEDPVGSSGSNLPLTDFGTVNFTGATVNGSALGNAGGLTAINLIDSEGADWQEVARIVLHIDPARGPERARRAWESHLARAKWMTTDGYRLFLRGERDFD